MKHAGILLLYAKKSSSLFPSFNASDPFQWWISHKRMPSIIVESSTMMSKGRKGNIPVKYSPQLEDKRFNLVYSEKQFCNNRETVTTCIIVEGNHIASRIGWPYIRRGACVLLKPYFSRMFKDTYTAVHTYFDVIRSKVRIFIIFRKLVQTFCYIWIEI